MSRRRKSKQSNVKSFAQKVVNLIESSPDNLIRWSDGGDTFLVLDKNALAKEELGKYFKHKNFSSFVRQLTYYQFTKVAYVKGKSSSEHKWEFCHKYFIRGRPDLLHLITRKNGQDQESVTKIKSLEAQVKHLKSKCADLESEVASLKELLFAPAEGSDGGSNQPKKRRRICVDTDVNSLDEMDLTPAPVELKRMSSGEWAQMIQADGSSSGEKIVDPLDSLSQLSLDTSEARIGLGDGDAFNNALVGDYSDSSCTNFLPLFLQSCISASATGATTLPLVPVTDTAATV